MKFETLPIIKNEQITLRAFSLSDLEDYYDYVSDEAVKESFSFNYTKETAEERLKVLDKLYQSENIPLVWAIELNETKKVIGAISIDDYSSYNLSVQLALGIKDEYTKLHYGEKVMRLFIDYLFTNTPIHRVVINHELDNHKTESLCRKLNFTYEGIEREAKKKGDKFVDRKRNSILKQEWI